MAEVTRILALIALGGTSDGELATRLVMACAQEVPVTGAGIVLMDGSSPAGVVAGSDEVATAAEALQFSLGEGPCVEASRSGGPVLHPDLAMSGPALWPIYTAGALRTGVRAVFAFPLRIGGIRLGVLDLYRDRIGILTSGELARALTYADAATSVLLYLQAGTDDGGVGVSVVEDHAEVHQATGVFAVQAGVPLSTALALLRARAFVAGRSLTQLSRDVVAGVVKFSDDEAQTDGPEQ